MGWLFWRRICGSENCSWVVILATGDWVRSAGSSAIGRLELLLMGWEGENVIGHGNGWEVLIGGPG